MKSVYRINFVPYYKPWRGGRTWFVNGKVFDFIKDQRTEEFCEIKPPEDYEDLYEYLHSNNIEVEFPYILYDELTLYGE